MTGKKITKAGRTLALFAGLTLLAGCAGTLHTGNGGWAPGNQQVYLLDPSKANGTQTVDGAIHALSLYVNGLLVSDKVRPSWGY
ncbi:hypothetical protein [Pseudomonas sp. TUM22785]|uniref:hypothetical protein n=1 Tax=Pseudomonas sp. TUM22785 TaxID=3019098 RepID=UPI0023060226|nr:hypothetical protein [Pseudomonas sp. TUM22785]WCD80548.1 hypothetical protein PI990_00620 [Pseudomonas sp. TUM22785]